MDIVYKIAGETLRKFIVCTAFIILLVGPIGSGKTSACVFKLLRIMGSQKPGPDGVRRTRFVVIRNTRPELISTTIKAVMGDYKRGTLRRGSGGKVTDRKQAIAIAMSEGGLSKPKKKKRSRMMGMHGRY